MFMRNIRSTFVTRRKLHPTQK